MTQLLLSVRDADEARIALAAGAALLDCKEPHRGSLGRPETVALAAIVREVAGCVPVSVAWGELVDLTDEIETLPAGVCYAKIGLAGCEAIDWRQKWNRWADSLPAEVAPVAVIYVDPCGSPGPEAILDLAFTTPCAAILFDTFDKSCGDLWRHISREQLAAWLDAIRDRGLLSVVGGSLTVESIARFDLAADYLAVRGAACRPNRAGRLCAEAARAVAQAVAAARRTDLSPSVPL
jgi:uncharacterized protein (UPF0264 family)